MFDSHCHLTDTAYSPDLDAVIARAFDAGVTGIVTIASNADDADLAARLADGRESIWCTAGIHPHDAHTADLDFGRIVEAVNAGTVVAIGETGLDYHYDHSPRDVQRRSFDRHLDLAAQSRLPVVVHSREAEADTIAAVRSAKGVHGVLHCFTGTDALLDAAIEADWHVSFGGMITFRKWDGQDHLRRVPLDRLLLETDGPYLAPVPHRGRRNEPAFMALTCSAAAGLLGMDEADLGMRTDCNARLFYGIG
jgi:TatD DNase family protein